MKKSRRQPPPCKRSTVKKSNTILTRVSEQLHGQRSGTASSAVAEAMAGQGSKAFSVFVKMSRLHCITPWQGRKGCAFWVPPSRKATADKEEKSCSSRRSPQGRRRTASFAIFWGGKKNGGWNFYLPPPFWNAFWGEKIRISLWN